MKRTMQEVEINWPVKALFNYVADITNHASWKNGTTDAIWVEGKNESGATFRELIGDTTNEYQITEFIPYQRRAIRSGKGLVSKTYVFEFEPKGSSTILRQRAIQNTGTDLPGVDRPLCEGKRSASLEGNS